MLKNIRKKIIVIAAIVICSFCLFEYLVSSHTSFSLMKLLKSVANTRTHTNCIKPGKGFRVCQSLPYKEIKCGIASPKKSKTGKPFLVPNVMFFIWFSVHPKPFMFYNYLALRSAASIQQPESLLFYYSKSLPSGEYWERAVEEIPCLKLVQIEEPTHALGIKMPTVVTRTDLARLNILIRDGGIYADGDVITLRNVDDLRIYPATLGRATLQNICVCIVLAKKNSLFLKEFYQQFPKQFSPSKPFAFTTQYLGKFVETTKVKVHVEESSFNRPNPYVPEDKLLSTTLDRINISQNYFLHIHTSALQNRRIDPDWMLWNEENLRTLDSVYGEAARIALFGSSDLIFKPNETTFEMKPQRNIFEFPPVIQKTAVIDDIWSDLTE